MKIICITLLVGIGSYLMADGSCFLGFANGEEQTSVCSTIAGCEEFIQKNPESKDTDKAVVKAEELLIDEIKNKGAGTRYVIEEFEAEPNTPSSKTTFQRKIITDAEGKTVILPGVEFITEFPNDQFPLSLDLPVQPKIFGDGSIHRFNGEISMNRGKYQAIVGEGDRLNRLTFGLFKEVGYVYVRGKGKLLLKDGSEIKLGY